MVDAAPLEVPTGVVHGSSVSSMDYDVRNKWCEALLNPKFRQGKHYLLRKVGDNLEFDALGVLTNVAVEAGITKWERSKSDPLVLVTPGGSHNRISSSVWSWAGFKGMHPSQPVPLELNGEVNPIWRWNDQRGMTFAEMAELIHAQY